MKRKNKRSKSPLVKAKKTNNNESSPSLSSFLSSPRAIPPIWISEAQAKLELAKEQFVSETQTKIDQAKHRIDQHTNTFKNKIMNIQEELDFQNKVIDFAERAGFHFDFFSISYISRLAFSIFFFIITAYINVLASVCAAYRTPWINVKDLDGITTNQVTLPDLGHDLVKTILNYLNYSHDYVNDYSLPDNLVACMFAFTFTFILFHPKRFQILRRMLMIFGIMNLLRAFTVSVTQLPDASPVCQAQFTDMVNKGSYKKKAMFPKAFTYALKFLLSPSSHITCGDMVFSGHTTCLMICGMVFATYCSAKHLKTKVFFRNSHISETSCLIVRGIVYVYVGLSALMIIGTKLHYTLDVSIAIYLTHRNFNRYHDWCKYERLRNDKRFRGIFHWLEAEEILSIEKAAYKVASSKKENKESK